MLTIAEMHDEFRIVYDNIDSFANPEYSPEEIDYFLNTAQDDLISQVKTGGVERIQTLRDFLSNITDTYSTTAFTTNGDNEPNGLFVVLPDDYRTALKESVDVTYTDCNNSSQVNRIPVIPTTHDRLNYETRNPFRKPSSSERVISVPHAELAATPQQQVIELITDGTFTINEYHLRYLRNPATMDINAPTDCELSYEAQKWIIKRAAELAFMATQQEIRMLMRKRVGE